VNGGIGHAGSVLLHVGYVVWVWLRLGAGGMLVQVVTVRLEFFGCRDLRLLLRSTREAIERMLWNYSVDICRAHNVIACARRAYNPPPTTDRSPLLY
jgi:hypothetical protein